MKLLTKHFDGLLYVMIGVCAADIDIFDTGEAKSLIPEGYLFFSLLVFKTVQAGCLALKMYRSTAYKDASLTVTENTATLTTSTATTAEPTK